MRNPISIFAICTLGFLMASNGWAQEVTAENFEKLKKLEGEWKGVKPDGKAVEISYKVMSGGSTIVETMMPENEPNMVTVYHLDGDKLMMTHYCSAGNQPRMVATAVNKDGIEFNFVDATNLKDKSEGHMEGLKIVFVDDKHFNQVWKWSKSDEKMPSTFKYERKR